MSLARIGCDGSDVYVWADVAGGYACADLDHWHQGDAASMIAHLAAHERDGRHVPPEVYAALAAGDLS